MLTSFGFSFFKIVLLFYFGSIDVDKSFNQVGLEKRQRETLEVRLCVKRDAKIELTHVCWPSIKSGTTIYPVLKGKKTTT